MTAPLYRMAIRAYALSIGIASIFSEKARKWKRGRKGLIEELEGSLKAFRGQKDAWIWVHSSSLGEFEQIRPVLEELRKQHPEQGICLSFFSPSGYEARKGKDDADIITYMPLDVPGQAKKFVDTLRPDLALFVKYELWYEHLKALRAHEIPVLLIAALFRPGHRYFRWYGAFFRKMLRMFDSIHVQELRSKELLEEAGIEDTIVSGDPRYDRVGRIAEEAEPMPMLERFKGDAALLIGGSSWPQEEKLLEKLLQGISGEWKLLIAPHDVKEAHIRSIEKLFAEHQPLRLTQDPDEGKLEESRVLIVDRIGLLARIYQHGDAALVGGGFSGALHNVLEPAAHGVPVSFGPDVTDFPEAVDLIVHDAAFAVTDHGSLNERMEEWGKNPEEWKRMSMNASRFIEARKGASEAILKELEERIAPR